MPRLSDFLFRLRALFRRDEMEQEMSEEFRFHLDMEAQKLEQEGMDPAEARRTARVRFGGEERFREQAREAWGIHALQDLLGDLRFSLRQIRKHVAFSTMGILTLALGMGGTVALFSVVNALVLSPLPVADEDRLVTFWSDYNWRGAEFDYLRERTTIFDGLAAYSDDATTYRTDAGSRLMLNSVGSAELFDVLGVRAALGRTFQAGDDRPGAEPVIVLSHGLWMQDFGGDRNVLGRRVEFGGQLRTVVGVMPDGFYYPSPESEAWVPLMFDPDDPAYAGNGWLVLTGRLRSGVTEREIEAELESFAALLGEQWDYPDAWDKTRNPHFTPTREYLLGDVRPMLILLFGAVGLVLLTACANVAALVLTRTMDRSGELGVRAALGAGRRRLARQVLTESIVLGVAAALVGTLVAVAAFDIVVATLPLPRELGRALEIDWSVFVVGMGLAIVAGGAIALAPMRALLRGDLSSTPLSARTQGGGARSRQRVQRVLVTAEVSLAVVLVTGAALLVRTVDQLRAIDWGIEPEGVMTIDLLIPEGSTGPAERDAAFEAIVERVAALPGVESAGLIGRIPVRDGGWQGTITLADRPDLVGERSPNSYYRPLSPGAFGALGMEIVEGRALQESDGVDDAPVAVVNETFARSMFGAESAVGRLIESNGWTDTPIQIVGVLRNVPVDDLVGEVPMAAYYPWTQASRGSAYGILVVRTALEPEGVVAPVRRLVAEIDPRVALGRTESMESIMDTAMVEPLRLRLFLGLFGLLGLVLGTVGVYGVVSYAVQRRRAEFGIRMALGAAPTRLLSQVLRDGMVPVVLGIAAGGMVAIISSTTIASFLFGVEPTDPLSFGAAATVLLLAGAMAAFVPAWRVSGTDPASALRAE